MASPAPFSISPFSAAFPQGKGWVCCPPQAAGRGSCLRFAQRPMGKAQALTRSYSARGSRLRPLAGIGAMLAPAGLAACRACPQPSAVPPPIRHGAPAVASGRQKALSQQQHKGPIIRQGEPGPLNVHLPRSGPQGGNAEGRGPSCLSSLAYPWEQCRGPQKAAVSSAPAGSGCWDVAGVAGAENP